MARHQTSAAKPKPEKPKAATGPAPSSYETTHPVGSAERFLDQAARDALAAAAVGGVPPLSRFIPGQPVIRESQTTTPIGRPLGGGQPPSGVQWAAKGGNTRSGSKGGDASGPETPVSETPVSETAAQQQGGPRIVINPQVFNDKRDALCVAFNEAFRVVMEANGFEPVSEPTDAQRKFFADTAYADDEVQLRRTILARIATLDTSVKDPTDEQLEETAEMLEMVMETGAPQNEWEQSAVQRLHDVVVQARESTKANGSGEKAPPPHEEASTQADVGGGVTEDDDSKVLPEQPAAPQPEQPAAPQPEQRAAPQPDTRPTAPMQKPDQGRVHAKWTLDSSFTDKDGRRVSNLHNFDRDEQGRVHAKWTLDSSFTDKDGRRVSNLHHFDRDEQGRVHAKWALDEQNA